VKDSDLKDDSAGPLLKKLFSFYNICTNLIDLCGGKK
jgi:hypothetical protein